MQQCQYKPYDSAEMTREKRVRTVLAALLLALALGASLFLRLAALDGFSTVDEPRWEERSIRFAQALARNNPEATYQSEHPGVTSLWIGALALKTAQWIDASVPFSIGGIPIPYRFFHPLTPGIPRLTFWARRFIALLTWLGIVALVWLLWKVFDWRVALAAGCLVALDPFYLALSRVHHLDALLTTFCMLSTVSLIGALQPRLRVSYLIPSGILGGLAIATKLPALVLIPWAGLYMLLWALRGGKRERWQRLAQAGLGMALWGSVILLTLIAIWPALRADPWSTLEAVYAGFMRQAWHPHENSNFFWGAPRPDPGAWFYPVAWFFRSTPWLVVGLGCALVVARRIKHHQAVLGILVFVLLYSASLTAGAKKFDRYLLPVFPLLAIVAAIGLTATLDILIARGHSRVLGVPVLLTALLAGQLACILPTCPQYLAFYNPLAGGTRTAAQVMMYGWGEALGEAARYLNSKPDAERLHVASHSPNEFAPFFKGRTTLLGSVPLAEPDYFVLYASHVQRGFVPEIVEHYFQRETPEHVISVNGLEYAWIYRNSFYASELDAVIDYVEAHGHQRSDVVLINAQTAFGDAYAGPYTIRELAGPPRDDYVATGLERATHGRNRVWLLDFPDLYEDLYAMIEARLQEQAKAVDEISVGAVRAICYQLRPGARFVRCKPGELLEYALGEEISLRGYDLGLREAEPGGYVSLRLYWQAEEPISTDYKVFVHLISPDGSVVSQVDAMPQGYGRPTSDWRAGELVVDDYQIAVPSDAPLGTYCLEFGMYDLKTMERVLLRNEQGQRLTDDRVIVCEIPLEE